MRAPIQLLTIALTAVCACVLLAAQDSVAGVIRLDPSDVAVLQDPRDLAQRRILTKFEIPARLAAGAVEIATLEVRAAVSTEEPSSGVAFDCFAVTSIWSSEEVDWADGWGPEGSNFDRTRHAACAVAPSDSSKMVFDVTGAVAGWASGETANNGIIIAAAQGEEASLGGSRGAGVGEVRPRLVIWYSPTRDF